MADQNVSRGKINRMFKYFRGKNVSLRYEYNDSFGGHSIREESLSYDRFEITDYQSVAWSVRLYKDNENVWIQDFDAGWEFIGLGQLKVNVGGPYHYFTIRHTHS